MLVKIKDNRIINLDNVVEIVKEDIALTIQFYCINDVRLSVRFEDKSMLDNAYNKIFTSYSSGNPGCDITEYVKRGTVV